MSERKGRSINPEGSHPEEPYPEGPYPEGPYPEAQPPKRRCRKIHTQTSGSCMICEEDVKGDVFLFHKTRRQTHKLCKECGVAYLKPILENITDNLRRDIRKDVAKVKCPGSIHSEHRNQCKKVVCLDEITVPSSHELSIDMFRVQYVVNNNTAYLCPEKKCGAITDIDPRFTQPNIRCQACITTWCRRCLVTPYHDGLSCIEYEVKNSNTDNAKFIWKMQREGKLKFCPQCKAPTLKNSGCNKMKCITCHVKWCWLCRRTGIDYSHYNVNNQGCGNRLWEGVPEEEQV